MSRRTAPKWIDRATRFARGFCAATTARLARTNRCRLWNAQAEWVDLATGLEPTRRQAEAEPGRNRLSQVVCKTRHWRSLAPRRGAPPSRRHDQDSNEDQRNEAMAGASHGELLERKTLRTRPAEPSGRHPKPTAESTLRADLSAEIRTLNDRSGKFREGSQRTLCRQTPRGGHSHGG